MPDDAGHRAVATATAAGGWPVFPCLPIKRPATRHGLHDATTDPARITAWWQRNPGHLVGTPTQGLVVVDLDDRPPAPCTWVWWQTLTGEHGWPIDANLVVATPSNGVHVYFAAPDGTDIRNSASKLHPGVDIRANGGYVIAPGSTLPDGRRYEVINLPDGGLPDAPRWLLDLIATATRPAPPPPPGRPTGGQGGTKYGVAALEAELGRLALAPQGQRNDTLVRAAYRAGQLAAGEQLDPVWAAGQLHAVAGRIGLGDIEATNTIRSGMTSGAQHPRRPER